MTEFVLVSCSKSKQDGVQLGRDLYEPSPIFRKRRKFAERRGDAWGILSAKHGYIPPGVAIEDYERHISDRTAVWGVFVLRDLLEDLRFHDVDQVTLLAGSRYVEPLVAELEARGYDVIDWNAGKRPGERMSALDEANDPTEQQPLITDGGRDTSYTDRAAVGNHNPEPMYCPGCNGPVPENYDSVDEAWRCGKCGSTLYASRGDYVGVLHGTARWEREHGYDPWYEGGDDGGE